MHGCERDMLRRISFKPKWSRKDALTGHAYRCREDVGILVSAGTAFTPECRSGDIKSFLCPKLLFLYALRHTDRLEHRCCAEWHPEDTSLCGEG
jgi:hypothetical protein